MKECPVCGAVCFDDMEMCYGCLHRFEGRDDEKGNLRAQMARALSSSTILGGPSRDDASIEQKKRAVSAALAEQSNCDAAVAKEEKALPPQRRDGKDGGFEQELLMDEWVLRIGVPRERGNLMLSLERPS